MPVPFHAFIALLALAAPSLPQPACTVVYGHDWAFIASPPKGWSATCGDKAIQGTAMSLQPSDQPPDSHKAVMYVTVSGKGHEDLAAFVKDNLEAFKLEAAKIKPAATGKQPMNIGPEQVISPTRALVHIAHSAFGRDEWLGYIQGPTAYFVVVLTTDSPTTTARYRPAFNAFLNGLSPASVKFENTHSSSKRIR